MITLKEQIDKYWTERAVEFGYITEKELINMREAAKERNKNDM